jgi:hypothetical protein
MRVVLVRHGESRSIEIVNSGMCPSDDQNPLTASGVNQMETTHESIRVTRHGRARARKSLEKFSTFRFNSGPHFAKLFRSKRTQPYLICESSIAIFGDNLT